ncbi:hypothetical protein HHK36_018916 [Tetracentron sinense]|uniref:DUF6598 domain-containing protein n=1 Tax=Tetracentron sinense TaxID=13715 RepID=A0A834YV95_TETSI|nr:hypothetical protein HHK36_018916 [Tetracentron sinense]
MEPPLPKDPPLPEELNVGEALDIKDTKSKQRTYSEPMVEVFSVSIMDIVGDLYGTITISDGIDSQFLYNRKREESESVLPGDTALLTGPAPPFLGYDSINIDVDLMDKDIDLPLVGSTGALSPQMCITSVLHRFIPCGGGYSGGYAHYRRWRSPCPCFWND